MAEIVLSVAAKLAEYLVRPTISQGRYLFCGDKITRDLESVKEKLTLRQENVQRMVEEALNRIEKVNSAVEKWLDEVKNIIAEVEKLEEELKANNGCVRGWCPTWKTYCLRKQMAKKAHKMIQLNTNSDFSPFSYRVALPDIEYFSSGNFMYFKSTKLASDKLLEALGGNSSYMIGLYGMGGSGKTTLVKEVGKKAKELKLYDRVIFTTVSQTPRVKRIQQEIADLLGLKLYHDESEAGRAREISSRLQSGQRILVILDDVWSKLNLEEIGISLEEINNSCKVLLTTRRLQVCALMDCQKKIPLDLLSEEESLTLFQRHAGIDETHFMLVNGLAQEIARECKRLHIAIEATGTSLKEKSIDEWKVALDKLKHSKPIDVEDGVRDAFTCLQLSYDYLRSKEAKMLFLMCSMFPEDHDISIEELFRYGIGLGLCGDVDSLEIARSQVNAGLNNLLSSCLLMISDKKKDYVKMHDMIRDVALWIASKEDLTILVNIAKDLNTLAEDGAIKEFYAVSSWYEEICQLPHQLDAPKLEILLLNTSWSLRSSHECFAGLKGLKVLAINAINYFKTPFVSVPQSTWLLTNLQTLCLVEWALDDISFVVNLTRLEILDLRGSYIKLPEIEKLKKLKLLDLSWSHIRDENCYNVIRRCSQLQELYFFGYYSGFVVTSEPSLDIVTYPKLQRYALKIGTFPRSNNIFPRKLSSTRSLYLGEMDISTSDEFIRDLVKRAKDIYLGRHQGGCKNFIPEMVQAVGGMNELTKLWLDSCSELECFIDTSFGPFQVDIVLPKLVKLILENMDNLREVCHGPPLHSFLENLEEFHIRRNVKLHIIFPGECNLHNLKILRIERCPKLMTSLFPMSVARTLVLLQELSIKKCKKLKHIITNDEAEIIPDNSSLMFPKLKIILVRSCHKLECIFSIYCAQGLVQLQEIRIADASELKYVFHQPNHESHLSGQIDIELPLLKVLKLQDLKNLLSICPENYQSRWPSLMELHWVNCPKLTFSCMNVMAGSELRKPHPDKGHSVAEKNGSQLSNEVVAPSPAILKVKNVDIQNCGVVNIFHLQGLGPGEDQQECMAFRLVRLRLENLHELRFVWTGPSGTQILTLQNLQHLEVYRCGKLKSIFSHVVYRISLSRLTRLIVSDCEELEEIIAENEEPQNLSSPQVCFPKLRVLRIQRCNKLKSLFSSAMASMLPQLKFLCILESVELEQVFTGRSEGSTNSGEEIFLPNLREIELRKLPSLIEFFQGFKFHSMKLHKVLISDCPKLASISGASQVISFHQGTEGVQADGINGSQSSDDVPALLPADLNVFELEINKCLAVKLFYPLGVESIASRLVRLRLYNLPELTLIGTGSKHFLSLHHLEYLEVNCCRKLQSIFCTVVHRSLSKLTQLFISDCEELGEIIADNEDTQNLPNAEVCFPKLMSLSVTRCHRLKSLFSTGMARMLPQLACLNIEEADQLEEIFGCRIDDNTSNREKIVLPNLRNIKLKQLPSLVDICQGFKVHAVDLHEVNIEECPKFTPILGATQLISLHQSKEELEVLMTADGEVSHEISAFLAILNVKKKIPIADEAGKIMTSDLETLCLKHLPDLMFIWNGPILISFQNLYSLEVTGCRKLKSIFSASVIRCLPKLNSLDINDCEELEKIISEGEGEELHFPNPSNSHPDQQVCFPNLGSICVWRCSKLKFLFPFSIAADLPKLWSLEIEFCSQLEQVFSCVHENYHGVIEFGLPKLGMLRLEGLPSLANICLGLESQLQLQALHYCVVKDCPNFPSTTIPTLHKLMGANPSQNTDDKEKEEEPEQKQEEVDQEPSLHDDGGDLLDNDDKDEDGAEDEDEDEDNDEERGDEENDEESSEEENDEDSDLYSFLTSKYYDIED